MSPVVTESMSSPHLTLSTRLVYQLGDPNSTLRATTDRRDPAVLVHAGGEVDAYNEHTWRQLISEAASVVTAPGPLVVDVTGLEFMGCCAFAVLAEEAQRCQARGAELRLVSDDPLIARLLSASGLGGVLSTYPTAETALASTAR